MAAVTHYTRGRELAADGDVEAALRCFQAALDEDAAFTPAAVETGKAAMANDDLSTAHAVLTAAHGQWDAFVGSPAADAASDAGFSAASVAAALNAALADVYRQWGDTLKQARHLEMAVDASPKNKVCDNVCAGCLFPSVSSCSLPGRLSGWRWATCTPAGRDTTPPNGSLTRCCRGTRTAP